MTASKVGLSGPEQALVMNTEVILTKNSVLQKTILLLAGLQEKLQLYPLPEGLSSPPGKISRGENYLGLPYVVLDYPRIAHNQDLLFIRSFFWWGHFFSSTLQVAGCYKEMCEAKLLNGHNVLSADGYHLGIAANPWAHHFEADNYVLIGTLGKERFEKTLIEMPHIKIAARWPLSDWALAAAHLEGSWQKLVGLIT